MKRQMTYYFVMAILLGTAVQAARIKDIVDIHGVRSNPLMGTGLIVGLNGTGDTTLPSRQMLASLLGREGMTFSPTDLTGGNIAIVMVTADLGPWDREGHMIDINVSAIGDATSLAGGVLLATELKGLDGEVYAVARVSSISTSSWSVESGKTGSKAYKNHSTVGRIPNGAHVEREEISRFFEVISGNRYITLSLRNSDFSTAERIGSVINGVHPSSAFVEDAGTVRVRVPQEIQRVNLISFLDRVTNLRVEVDSPAKVVINERTGTIIVGGNVGISEAAIAQGSLVVKVKEQQLVSQPIAPFTDGATTQVVPDTEITVQEEEGHLIPVPRLVTVEELANTLNAIGATPRDLIAIFQALKQAGALQAELETM